MNKDESTPSIIVSYYDIKKMEKENPGKLIQRCCGEIIAICEEVRLAIHNFAIAARQGDVTDATRLCKYYYEDAVVRIYSLRERAWDFLAALVKVPRKKTGDKQFRQNVLGRLERNHPELGKSFNALLAMIKNELQNRNISTHQTLLFFGVTFSDDLSATYEVDSVLMWHDPESVAGKELQTAVKKGIEKFVSQETKQFREIINQALEVARFGCDAIQKK